MPNFSKRETGVLLFGIAFVILFFGFQLGVAPVLETRENLERILVQRRAAIEEMGKLRQEFVQVTGAMDDETFNISARKEGFSLFSFLDAQAEKSGVKENVVYMKPFTKKHDRSGNTLSLVKIKLKEVYYKDLMDFLFRIEYSPNYVRITSLSLAKAGKEKVKMDALIETQTPLLAEKA